ncbi:uncharacterized protein PgNI_01368 [Pyricularia grisea]|uniref:Uncharacterized protein n=1 Tax=Pyricularia grisea TaxID=148305 RepID=A0A6P8BFL1_PYRGI|nr:uncharacterized protein PgNI_01368 [Pyricularia grisea]TLD15583.1 hypothetical protein PgNI_01368 [Pyricularia grisea]
MGQGYNQKPTGPPAAGKVGSGFGNGSIPLRLAQAIAVCLAQAHDLTAIVTKQDSSASPSSDKPPNLKASSSTIESHRA